MLRSIVFDLDGTLWQTENSYVYAYNKMCDFYNITDRFSDDVVKSFLGVKLDKLFADLFPSIKYEPESAYRAVSFSIEYLLKNPEGCCYYFVPELLTCLSERYNVYIVSNCPSTYVDAFFSVSGVQQCIKGVYTIEKGEKIQHINDILMHDEGKILFVGDSYDDYASIKDHYSTYFCYASYGYKECNQYDYIIQTPKDLLTVIKNIEIKERQLKGKEYRILSYDRNQLTLIRNPDNTAYFGFVKYADVNFGKVVQMLKCENHVQGFKSLIGPIDGNTFYPYRFAINNFDWKLYPDCVNGESVVCDFINNGFAIKQKYVSVLAKIDYDVWKKCQKTILPKEYKMIVLTGHEVYEYLDELYDIAVASFKNADFYEPISREDFIEIYVSSLNAVSPDVILVYNNDIPVAFCFCYGDPEKRFYVCKTIAIKEEFRNNHVVRSLIDFSYRMMEKNGYTEVLHHYKNLRNRSDFAMFKRTFVRQKEYALLELADEK